MSSFLRAGSFAGRRTLGGAQAQSWRQSASSLAALAQRSKAVHRAAASSSSPSPRAFDLSALRNLSSFSSTSPSTRSAPFAPTAAAGASLAAASATPANPAGDASLDSILGEASAATSPESSAAALELLNFSPPLSDSWYTWFPEQAHALLSLLHSSTGLPWWATVLLATVIVRTAIFPLLVKQARNMAAMTLAKPELAALREQQTQLLSKYRVAGMAPPADEMMRSRVKTKEVMDKYGAKPMHAILTPVVQVPIFLSMFAALRTMGYVDPSFLEEGVWWFQNLGQLDAGFADLRLELWKLKLSLGLPILNMGLIMTSVYLNSELSAQSDSPMAGFMKKLMYGFAVISVPICSSSIPAGVMLYWCASNVYAICAGQLLRSKWGKKLFGIPELPPQHDALAEMEKNWAQVRRAFKAGVVQQTGAAANGTPAHAGKALNPFDAPPAAAATDAHTPVAPASESTSTLAASAQAAGAPHAPPSSIPPAPSSINPHAAQDFYRKKAAAKKKQQ